MFRGYCLLVVWGVFLGADAYSSGAPARACETMLPDHYRRGEDVVPQTTPPSFRIEIEGDELASTYTTGQEIIVKIVSTRKDHEFRGFLLQARSVNGGVHGPVGKWEVSKHGTKTVCGSLRNEALTQRYGRGVEVNEGRWIAPSAPVGDVIFVASVVKSHREFWVNITSPILRDGSVMPTTPLAASSHRNSTACEEGTLVAFREERPGVAILCYENSHCPCGWVCCRQCQTTLAICRQPLARNASLTLPSRV